MQDIHYVSLIRLKRTGNLEYPGRPAHLGGRLHSNRYILISNDHPIIKQGPQSIGSFSIMTIGWPNHISYWAGPTPPPLPLSASLFQMLWIWVRWSEQNLYVDGSNCYAVTGGKRRGGWSRRVTGRYREQRRRGAGGECS